MTRGKPHGSLPVPPQANFSWTDQPHIKLVTQALSRQGPDVARFVGGCVRDGLLGFTPNDIDIATVLTPAEVQKALTSAGLKSAPTGIEHGTVTAIAKGEGVEVTTLRADVSTDGRRASVAFTDDWRVDAARRDFTMNALYLSFDRELIDPLGTGLDDLSEGKVRFIGNADDRLREDYLRILRFFRFSARFSKGEFEPQGLEACARLKGGVAILSAERIGQEMVAICRLPNAMQAIRAMHGAAILAEIWSAEPDIERGERVKRLKPDAPAPVLLAALYWDRGDGLGNRLRLSGKDEARRSGAINAATDLERVTDPAAARRLLYAYGNQAFRDGALLNGQEEWIRFAKTETRPVFPIAGRDLLAAGLAPGPQVSRLLDEIEGQWIDENFPDEARARAILAEVVARQGEA